MLLSELKRVERPIKTAGAAHYPFRQATADRYKFKSRFGDEVLLHRVEGDEILLPRELCPVGHEDARDYGEDVVFPKEPLPREYQKPMFTRIESLMKQKRSGVLVAATGYGKTILGFKAAYEVQKKTLVITTKEDIYDSWLKGAVTFLGLDPSEVGEIRGDKCEVIGTKFCVALIQSMSKDDKYPDWIANGFGLVIFDEVHRVGADQFSRVADMFPALIRLGLSATPDRADGKEVLIYAHIGPVLATATIQLMVPKVLRVESNWTCPRVYRTDPETNEKTLIRLPHTAGKTAQMEKIIAADDERNRLLAELVAKAFEKGRKIVLFSTLHSHLQTIHGICHKEFGISGKDMGYYLGATKKADKEKREREKVKPILFTTYTMMGEGTSIDWLDTCILAMPRSKVTQPVGRIRREYDGKKEPVVMDVIDRDSPIFSNYANSRAKWYESIGSRVVDYS